MARGRFSYARIIAGLTATNGVVIALGLITGPLLARALGPSGRGELAAILVPLALMPAILDVGLTAFLARERARGTPRDVLLGTLVPVALALSVIGLLAAYPLAVVLADGRSTVMTWLVIGLLLSPLTSLLQLLLGIPLGEERWRLFAFVRVASPALTVIVYVVLFAIDQLTVDAAAATTLAAGVIANAPLLVAFRGYRSWRFRRSVARDGVRFGTRAWVATISGGAGARLDQLLMAPLVSSRQLGLYTVAVTTAGFAQAFVAAVGSALNPQASRGDVVLIQRSARVTGLLLVVAAALMAAGVPYLLPLLFGSSFTDAVGMVWILLPASVASGISVVLNVGLSGTGHPGEAAKAMTLPVVVSIPLLLALLPSTGGVGAAWITLGTSTLGLAMFVAYTVRICGGTARDILVPRRSDLRVLRSIFARALPVRRDRSAGFEDG